MKAMTKRCCYPPFYPMKAIQSEGSCGEALLAVVAFHGGYPMKVMQPERTFGGVSLRLGKNRKNKKITGAKSFCKLDAPPRIALHVQDRHTSVRAQEHFYETCFPNVAGAR